MFRLDARSDRAPFRQLVDQVVSAVDRGQLQPGDQLPSVREVVRQITINPNTVHRAYRELEHLGLVEGRLGLGTFVLDAVAGTSREYRAQSWRDALREGIVLARDSGMGDDELLVTFQRLMTSEIEAPS
ncbi:MAG: GntR family transcriptional regulator [Acidimicrobiales bacterium]